MAKEIPLDKGQVAIVDDEDFEWLSKLKWHAAWSPTTKSYRAVTAGLANIPGNSANIGMPKLITGAAITDHADHDTLNNTRANLRPCTSSQNAANRRNTGRNKTGVKGVFKSRNKFRVRLGVNGVRHNGGTFNTVEEAAEAYKKIAIKYFGEFAKAE
jgi:hypothetical protein